MPVKITNNGVSTLAAGVNPADLSITVAAGHGVRFPALAAGEFFFVTVQSGATYEIMRCTSRSGDVLTVARGQDGTAAASWSIGAAVEGRVNAAVLDAKLDKDGGTLTGPLVLAGDATTALHPMTKQQTDTALAAKAPTVHTHTIAQITDAGASGRDVMAAATDAAARAAIEAAKSGAVTGSDITMASGRILGRTTALAGAIEEIAVDSTLSLTGGTMGVNLPVASRTTYNSSTTWNKPAGYSPESIVLLEAWGAGGSGARNSAGIGFAGGAGGGGGGGYMYRWVKLSDMGASESLTVGAGGVARTSNLAGAAGSNTTIGSLLTAFGGSGGILGFPAVNVFNSGAGGLMATGVSGQPFGGGSGGGGADDGAGGMNVVGAGNGVWGAGGGGGATNNQAGGASLWGGAGGAAGNPTTGVAGTAPGGGGGAATGTSGAGANGRIIITIFARG